MTTDQAIRRAFDVFRDVAKNPDHYRGDVLVLPLETLLAEAGSPFTKQRLRLLMEIRRRAPSSLDQLAARVHREKTRVSKDVKFLEGLGLIKSSQVGRTKRLESTGHLIILE